MRRLFVFMMVSLDGYFEGKNHNLDWHVVDAEFNDFAIAQLHNTDTLLFGHRTYELMANFWPTEAARKNDPIVAGLMNATTKFVASRRPMSTLWQNSFQLEGTVVGAVRALKQQVGKDIAVFGSSNLCLTLIRGGLIDEFRLMINPVVLGAGTPLFSGLKQPLNLTRIGTRAFRSGNTLLNYVPTV